MANDYPNLLEALESPIRFSNNEVPKLYGAAKRKNIDFSNIRDDEKPPKLTRMVEPEETTNNQVFELLKTASLNLDSPSAQEILRLLPVIMGSESSIDNNSNSLSSNQSDMLDQEELVVDEEEDEWQEEFKKLDRESDCLDSKDQDRRRQMAKNREYARKCVQKKKDMRKQAEVRANNIIKRIALQQKMTLIKERNANFAVDLRRMMGEEGVDEERKTYDVQKVQMIGKFDRIFGQDETVNLNFMRLASSREEFEKAAIDLRMKSGVIGTLGSRKIRAKQAMEWRQHLYNISVNEHKLRRELKLSELADDYVRRTVPGAAPLVQSIPKDLLDELIKSNRTSELEEFVRFVAENLSNFQEDTNNETKDSVVK